MGGGTRGLVKPTTQHPGSSAAEIDEDTAVLQRYDSAVLFLVARQELKEIEREESDAGYRKVEVHIVVGRTTQHGLWDPLATNTFLFINLVSESSPTQWDQVVKLQHQLEHGDDGTIPVGDARAVWGWYLVHVGKLLTVSRQASYRSR